MSDAPKRVALKIAAVRAFHEFMMESSRAGGDDEGEQLKAALVAHVDFTALIGSYSPIFALTITLEEYDKKGGLVSDILAASREGEKK